MKRKIIIAVDILLIIITLKLISNIGINSKLINSYYLKDYSEKQAKALTYFNFSESYIANYNYGNILYQEGEYERAIEKYKKALDGIIPKKKECNIRINLALSICKTVSINKNSIDSVKDAIKIYESAIDVLTEKGCANKENNNGHSSKAQQLKNDIQKEIDRLKNLQENQGDNDEEDEGEEQQENKIEEKNIEEKLQNIKEEAIKEQREVENQYKNYNKEFITRTKNW